MTYREFIDSLDEEQLDALQVILDRKNAAIEAERDKAEEYRSLVRWTSTFLSVVSMMAAIAAIFISLSRL
jgi:hypothetical protein